MNSILAMCLVANAACGYSPLFNHTHPVRAPESVAIESENSLSCKLQFQSQNLCADFVWVKESQGYDEGSMNIYFWHPEQPGVFTSPSDLQVGVKLWMPDMGHGSQKVKVSSSQAGVFDATEIVFVMGGEWEIQFQLKDGNGNVVEMQKTLYQAQ